MDGKFTVSGVGTNNDIAKGPDGNMWVTLDQTNDVAKITPRGVVTEFNPANVTSPVGITAGPDGNIWVTQAGGVARFSPNQPRWRGQVRHRRRQRPAPDRHRPRRQPVDHQRRERDPDPAANPTTATSFGVLVAGRDIDASRDGRLWVADFASQVVRVTTAGVAKAFSTGDGSGLQSIAAGPKSQVAYADPTSQPEKIGRVSSSGQIQKTNTPGDPFGVAFGNDNAYWFPRFATGDLVRLTPAGVRSHLGGLGPNSGPRRIATGPTTPSG